MDNYLHAIAHNPLLLSSLLIALLASIASGIMGSYIVVKRVVFLCGSIAHSVLGGMGLFLWLKRSYHFSWAQPVYGALLAAVLSAWLIGWVHMRFKEREDTLIAAIWSIGMAAGIIFISLTPGYNVELTSFLLGNILWVRPLDLYLIAALDLVIVALTLYYHKYFQAICFDETQAALQEVPIKRMYILLLTMIALTVVLLIQVVGIVLVITLLTIPSALANLKLHRLSSVILASIILSMLFCLSGSALSYHLNWPLGATIALISGGIYLLALLLSKKRQDA